MKHATMSAHTASPQNTYCLLRSWDLKWQTTVLKKMIHWAGDASFSNIRLQVPSGHMIQRSGNLHRVNNSLHFFNYLENEKTTAESTLNIKFSLILTFKTFFAPKNTYWIIREMRSKMFVCRHVKRRIIGVQFTPMASGFMEIHSEVLKERRWADVAKLTGMYLGLLTAQAP